MQCDTNPFNNAFYDNRFTSGRVPYDLFYPFMYLQQINFAKVNISFGSNLTPLTTIKRLNYVILNCGSIPSASKMTGTLPTVLSTIDMAHFEVNYTNITGSLPTEYGQWKNLEFLHFIGNATLGGPMPSSYGNFPKITMIRAMENVLTGAIPSTFENYAVMNVGINLNTNYFTCSPPLFMARYNTNVISQRTNNIGACY